MTYRERREYLDVIDRIYDSEESGENIITLTRTLSEKLPDQDLSYLINTLIKNAKITSTTRVLLDEYRKLLNGERNIFESYLCTISLDEDTTSNGTEIYSKTFSYLYVKTGLNILIKNVGFKNTVKFIKYLIEIDW